MDVEALNNDTVLSIWNDIKSGGLSFYIFFIMFNLTFLKEQWLGAIKYVFDKVFKGHSKSASYTKKDLLKHPIFNDLEYWLNIGIDALHIKENLHPEEDDYINNKERMAKEVIRIKYETMKAALKSFVEEIDIDSLDNEVACQYLMDCLTKESITQKRKFNERGIPLKFLNKFYVISDISKKIIYTSIRNFFSNNCESTTATKMYMAFNTLDGYLNIVFNDLCETMSTINGDLKEEIFDGKPMGQPAFELLKAPHPTYPMIVKEKLDELLRDFNGSRAMVSKYFNKNGEHYHSAVYESTINGITSEIKNVQMVSDDKEKSILRIMEAGNNIAADISKFDANTIERFNARGVKAIIIAPIYNDNKIDGALSIDFIAVEKFEELIKNKDLDKCLKDYCEMLSTYIQYPADFKF